MPGSKCHHSTIYLTALCLYVTFLAACNAESGQVARSEPEAYVPNEHWAGLIYCAGRTFPLTLTLTTHQDQSVSGHVAVSEHIQRPNKTGGGYSLFGAGEIQTGSYDPHAREIRLTAESDSNKTLALSALLSADGNKAVLRTTVGRGRPCEMGIMASGGQEKFIATLADEISLIQDNIRPDKTQSCDAPVRAWLDEAAKLQKDKYNRFVVDPLLSDAVLREFFGKTYTEFSAGEVREIGAQLSSHCLSRDDRRDKRQIATRLMGEIINRRYFEISRFNVFREQVIRSWQDHMRKLLASDALIPYAQASRMAGLPQVYRFADVLTDEIVEDQHTGRQRAPTHRYDFSSRPPKVAIVDELTTYAQAMGVREQAQRSAALLLDSKDDFQKFTTLYGNIMNNKEADNTPATAVYNRHLEESAIAYAGAQELTLAKLAYMQQWINAVTGENRCTESVRDACEDAVDIFADAIDDHIDEFLDQDETAFKLIKRENKNLANLARLVELHSSLDDRYGALLEHRDVAQLMEELTEHRRDLQHDLDSELLKKLAEQQTTPQMRRFENTYFLLGDLEERGASKVRKALE
ncbi:MAG: hypothetical protein KDI01_10345, partial [Halioglobus sp.]|nr:hypothetical protein [Halioglobus sp.]